MIFSWFYRKPARKSIEVPIPALKGGDELHNMTVLPYLNDHYYEEADNNDDVYYTERELNGKKKYFLKCFCA